MSDASSVPSPQRTKPVKARDETATASRIPVKHRPAQPPLHIRVAQTRTQTQAQVEPHVHSGHAIPVSMVRRGRSNSTNPMPAAAKHPPHPAPAPKRVPSDPTQESPGPSPGPSPIPSPSPSLTTRAPQGIPPPSQSLVSRIPQGAPGPSPSLISRPPQGVTFAAATQIPRPAQAGFYKRAQSVGVTSYITAESARLRMIERATRARLYLLHQSGPNKFLIGGDALDSRFHVTIGPQNCSCGKLHCIHLLFVMLRVLKVSPSDPLLWSKQLRNYEAETLLQDLHVRFSQRSTPKKINRRRFDFSTNKMQSEGGLGSMPPLVKCGSDEQEDSITKVAAGNAGRGGSNLQTEFAEKTNSEVGDGESEVERGEDVESDKSEEEDVCPICLNELDEGEDLITCRRCGNRLHQHCMDIWAGEQIRKKETVHCPVCRTPWQYPLLSLSLSPSSQPVTQPFLPVSIPMGSSGAGEAGEGGLRLKSLSSSHIHLTGEKAVMVEKIKKVFGAGVVDGVFSPDWKTREMTITHISREVITLLLPQMKTAALSDAKWRELQDATFLVIINGCSDSVLKVFLAALELLRVVLGYSVCSTEEDVAALQFLLQPLLLTLLTRCADAQSRVKECCIDTMCHLCLGQEGPLSLGSGCGQTSPHCASSLPFVMKCALKREEQSSESGHTHSWHWWLGRLNFLERIIQRFSWDFLLANCVYHPPFAPPSPDPEGSLNSVSSMRSVEAPLSSLEIASDDETDREQKSYDGEQREASRDSLGLPLSNATHGAHVAKHTLAPPPPTFPHIASPRAIPTFHPAAENNLLAQAWYFAARATHVPHHKVGKVARRLIIRIAKVLRNESFSLEIVHDVVSRCHRTHAEGLLDRVYSAREKSDTSSLEARSQTLGAEGREKRDEPTAKGGKARASSTQSSPQPYTPYPKLKKKGRRHEGGLESAHSCENILSPELGGVATERRQSEAGSDDSYRSAVSDLSVEEREGEGDGRRRHEAGSEAQLSSGTSSDSKSEERQSKSSASGGSAENTAKLPRYYHRQTTADSMISSVSTDTDSSIGTGGIFRCKQNIEEEEAAAEAKVRSMLPQDAPHPSLGILPPNPEVLIHVQAGGSAEATDSAGSTYMEGRQWVKGKLIGTGAFCSCFLARDARLGTMMAVKQVSYVRNTKTDEEEELKRLHDEVHMLGRLSHPNVVRCLGATQHEGHINIFIEWMAGGCLDQVLHDFGPFSESVVCNYTRQIIYGIVYLHEHGIIHRDLKGGNILLDSTGQRIRIADFGAAARLASHTTGQGEFQDMEGTVAFMAPEVVRGGSTEEGSTTGYGRKCDVWSIGCVIIQMASAKAPWTGTYDVKNKFQLIFKIGQATAPPPMPPFSDPALKDLALRCLEVRPEERPVSSELLKHPLFTSS